MRTLHLSILLFSCVPKMPCTQIQKSSVKCIHEIPEQWMSVNGNNNPAEHIKTKVFYSERKKKKSNIVRVQLLVHTTEFLLHFSCSLRRKHKYIFACVRSVALLRLPRLSRLFSIIRLYLPDTRSSGTGAVCTFRGSSNNNVHGIKLKFQITNIV